VLELTVPLQFVVYKQTDIQTPVNASG